MDRMQGEHRRGPPGARHAQSRQKSPEQHSIGRLQQDVDQMKAKWLQSPKVILRPKGRKCERVILRGCIGVEPDLAQPIGAA